MFLDAFRAAPPARGRKHWTARTEFDMGSSNLRIEARDIFLTAYSLSARSVLLFSFSRDPALACQSSLAKNASTDACDFHCKNCQRLGLRYCFCVTAYELVNLLLTSARSVFQDLLFCFFVFEIQMMVQSSLPLQLALRVVEKPYQ